MEEGYNPDILVLLQPTSPFRKSKHIDEAMNCFLKSDAESLVSVVKIPHNYSPFSAMTLKDGLLKPYLKIEEENNLRQKKPKFFARNGAAIYISTFECIMNNNSFFGKNILSYEMNASVSIDIDTEWDFYLAEKIMEDKNFENSI